MTRFVLRRALRGLVTLWLVVTAVFVVLRLSGDPALAMLGPDATPEAIAAFRVRHGLDEPIPVQYGRYLSGVVRGDFGDSLNARRPAMELFRLRIGATLAGQDGAEAEGGARTGRPRRRASSGRS